jgi:hypothetical protein
VVEFGGIAEGRLGVPEMFKNILLANRAVILENAGRNAVEFEKLPGFFTESRPFR